RVAPRHLRGSGRAARLPRPRPRVGRRARPRRHLRRHLVRRRRTGRRGHRRRRRGGAAEGVRRVGQRRVSVGQEDARVTIPSPSPSPPPRPRVAGIRLEDVTKVYSNDVTAVDDVSLDIADGEFMVLVGPSGCGKSTLLRIIAGLEVVSAGRVLIGDDDVTDVRPQDRDLAMVFQNYALYPHMTVAANLAF